MQWLKTTTIQLTILWINNIAQTHLGHYFCLNYLKYLIIASEMQVIFADLFCILSHLCDCGWGNWANSALDHILSFSSRLACKGSCRLGFKFAQCHFCWILLTEASHKVYSDSREGVKKLHFLMGEDEMSPCTGHRYRKK